MLHFNKPDFRRLPQHFLFAGSLCIAAGLSCSHFLLSVGTVLITASFICTGNYKSSLKSFWQNKLAVLCFLILLVSILSWFNSTEKAGWYKDVRIKLPFLLLPLGFCAAGIPPPRRMFYIFGTFMISVGIITLLSTINFAVNYREISEAMLKAKPIPITGGISHIYFGVQMAFAVFVSFYLLQKHLLQPNRSQRIFVFFLGLIPLAGLHILSSRTGLLVFYLAAACVGVRELLMRKKYIYVVLFFISMLAAPIVTYSLFSSFRNKVTNTVEDLRTYSDGSNRNFYSISMRLESLETAYLLFREHPLTGVGIGDLDTTMDLKYSEKHSLLTPENRILPHNEFLYYMAAYGIAGTSVLVLLIFYPLFNKRYNRHFLFLPFWVITFSGLMVEALFERQIGVTFFVFFLMLLIQSSVALRSAAADQGPNS